MAPRLQPLKSSACGSPCTCWPAPRHLRTAYTFNAPGMHASTTQLDLLSVMTKPSSTCVGKIAAWLQNLCRQTLTCWIRGFSRWTSARCNGTARHVVLAVSLSCNHGCMTCAFGPALHASVPRWCEMAPHALVCPVDVDEYGPVDALMELVPFPPCEGPPNVCLLSFIELDANAAHAVHGMHMP